jgi:hypothetical protein
MCTLRRWIHPSNSKQCYCIPSYLIRIFQNKVPKFGKIMTGNNSLRSNIILSNALVSQLVKKFSAFYGTRKVSRFSLYWARSIQSKLSNSTSLRALLIFTTYIGLCLFLPNVLPLSCFFTEVLCAITFSPTCPTSTVHHILFDLFIRKYLVQRKSMKPLTTQ